MATVVLAGLDVAGAVAAKEWAEHRATLVLVAGLVLAVLLFVVYAASLQYASLTTVTFGWVVMLQVGVVLVDRFRYDERFRPGHLGGRRGPRRRAGVPAARPRRGAARQP